MKKPILSTLLATALMTVSTSAMAAQIDGAVNVDNRFMVVVSQNGVNTIVHTAPSSYSWGQTATRFSFNVEDGDLKQCHISLINWGDGSVAEGFAGVFKGANGAVYTGGSGFTAKQSSINAGGFGTVPSQGVVDSIVPATSGGITNLGSTQNNPTWGSVKPFYTPNDFGMSSIPTDFDWIRPAGTNKTTKNHFVYSTPCSNLVKPTPVAVNMPGEHYQCYMLEKGDRLKPETIMIQDQFGKSKAVLGRPRMLCNPSSKIHNDKEYGIRNKERHLVCYNYVKQEKVERQTLMINNQFAPDEVISSRRQMFCVPSSKVHTDRKNTVNDTKYDRVRPTRPVPRQQRR